MGVGVSGVDREKGRRQEEDGRYKGRWLDGKRTDVGKKGWAEVRGGRGGEGGQRREEHVMGRCIWL